IPDRLFEGYGPNAEAIRGLAAQGATLLVTVDCGTMSYEPLEEARKLGLDVIVIDHHQADERLPAALAVVNPNRLDDLSKLGHLAFLLGPRINAGGRIGRATLGAELLMQDDPSESARIAAELDRLNRERQAIEVATVAQAEAEAMAALGAEEKGAVVVTAAEGWHPGVVGLVAARLRERFGRPSFAVALEPGGIGTGSGRSIAGVDLGRAVRQAVSMGLLIKGCG